MTILETLLVVMLLVSISLGGYWKNVAEKNQKTECVK